MTSHLFTHEQIRNLRLARKQGASALTLARLLGVSEMAVRYWTDDGLRERTKRASLEYARKSKRKSPEPIQTSAPVPQPAPAPSKYHEWLERWQAA